MRNKIKQLMNKEEGFTLVELLAVIVILGIILAIAIPSVGGIITRAGQDSYKAEDALIEDAARIYFTQNPEEKTVKVSFLDSEDYLDLRDSDISGDDLARDVTVNDGVISLTPNAKIISEE